jgi:hypothetical protein
MNVASAVYRSHLQARWMRQDYILLGLIGAPQSMSASAPPNSAARAMCQQAASQACPDMNEAANQGDLRDDRCAGAAERCRTTRQHQELATVTGDLYKSRDTCGSFLRLVRLAHPC